MRQNRIAFIKLGSFSHTNEKVLEILTKEFPDFEIDTVDIWDLLNSKEMLNILSCIREYGLPLLLDKKELRTYLLRTPYFFKKVRKLIKNRLAKQKYVFTFQTQSLFDASIPGTPHFLYTDHTLLANLHYPIYKKRDFYSDSWVALEKTIYHNTTLNFTMSSNISKSMVEQYACAPNKVACVYCGSNVKFPAEETLKDNRYSKMNILFVGVDWERKGGPYLVEAFKSVLEVHPEAQLTIVGCSPDLDLPNCRIVGRVPLSEVSRYYKEASVFCLPTRLEPFGIVFLEAFAHKLPVVATNIGALPDFISDGKNGYLVGAGDTKQLAQRLIEVIGDPDKCKSFGENGCHVVKKQYTWEKTGIKIRHNIERLLKEDKAFVQKARA